ncbi:zinc finger C2HC domain-containing protein 1C [Amphiprion ocellaris]|uniref:zinc finger C2HC domain-containing protein 1C n=1 Tax=Amphiprion ocellaris TaxID=80972 RepID=UPI00241108E2|nr:zinc finger C2HC domain-containing protein 1C [Amphiprion ocellaris]
MSTYTRRAHSPQRHYNSAGQRHGNVSTHTKHAAGPNRKANMTDQPFPNKPISHRRPPRTQVLLDSHDFEKITVSTQPRDTLPPQQHHTSGIRETNGSWHSRIDSHVPRRELQMAQAIQAKERMLQEKLWQLEGKIKQKILRDSADTAAGDDQKSGEERSSRRQAERGKAQTKTRISEPQRKEPVKSRDVSTLERRREDLKQPQTKREQRTEGRVRNTHEVQQNRREVAETAQSRGKGNEGNEIIFNKQEVNGELTKSRWQDVKEHTRRKGGGEKDYGIRGEAEKTKYRKQSEGSMGSAVSAIEKKFGEMTHKETDSSDDEPDMPQKTGHGQAMENHRRAGRKLSRESDLPLVDSASCCSQQQQEELALMHNTDSSVQLFPCKICNRKFFKERLEKHVQVCKKVKQSHRKVFNSYVNRTKGSAIEEYLKTHTRSKTPEVLKKKNQRQNYKGNISNLHQDRLPAGTLQIKRPK